MPPYFAAVDVMDLRPRPLPPLLVDKYCPSFIRGLPSKELVHWHTVISLTAPEGQEILAVRVALVVQVVSVAKSLKHLQSERKQRR